MVAISVVPWWSGSGSSLSLAIRSRSEFRSTISDKDMAVYAPNISAAFPTSLSASSLPGTPQCPLSPSAVGRPGSKRRDSSVGDTQSPPLVAWPFRTMTPQNTVDCLQLKF